MTVPHASGDVKKKKAGPPLSERPVTPPTHGGRAVLREGLEPSRPFGHTLLRRARLPLRHLSVATPPGRRVNATKPYALGDRRSTHCRIRLLPLEGVPFASVPQA